MVHPPGGVPTSVRFHCADGFDTRTLAWMLDSLVRVSRRVAYDHYASVRAKGAFLGPDWPHYTLGYKTPRKATHSESL